MHKSIEEALYGFVGRGNSSPLKPEKNHKKKKAHPKIKTLLTEFEEPKQLPLVRAFDHKIPLIVDVKPVNKRPCRSSFVHKKEIEKLVKKGFLIG